MIPFTLQRVETVQHILQHTPYTASNNHTQAVLNKLKVCRTAALGYHLYKCSDAVCNALKYQYHSCRNRHCPNCGGLQKEEWIEQRKNELLPIDYYHVVFTLPHELNSVILGNRTVLFNLLFDASKQTLLRFASDEKYLGATPGIISILHTWGQQLSFHPHVHCIVSGGGIVTDNEILQWKNATRNKDGFLFPVKAMNIVFRALYLEGLKKLTAQNKLSLLPSINISELIRILYKKDWIVYAKKPFGGPQQVIDYLGRYTHKVAIGNQRIKKIDGQEHTVTFEYKDYADDNKQKAMTLDNVEFIRRFEQHILPKGFTKIRSYGYLSNRGRTGRINAITTSMELPAHPPKVELPLQVKLLVRYGIKQHECPKCKQETLELVAIQLTNAPIIDSG